MFNRYKKRSIAMILVLSLFFLPFASCKKLSKLDQYKNYLALREYSKAAALSESFAQSTDRQLEADRILASHILELQSDVTAGKLEGSLYYDYLVGMEEMGLGSESVLQAAMGQWQETEEEQAQVKSANQAVKEERWADALMLLSEARPYSVSTASLRQQYANVRTAYKQDVMTRVEALETKGNLSAAAELLADAANMLPGDNELALAALRVDRQRYGNERQALIQNVSNLRAQEAYTAALDAIDSASEDVRQDAEVMALQDQIQLQYEEALLVRLEQLEADDKIEEALDQVRQDLDVFPESLRLLWKERVYERFAELPDKTVEDGE